MTKKEFAGKVKDINRQVYDLYAELGRVGDLTDKEKTTIGHSIDKVFTMLCDISYDCGETR